MVRFRSSLWVTPATILCRDFSQTLTTMAFDHSSFRWFEACSCKPAPRGPPSSFVQLRTLYEKNVLVAHYYESISVFKKPEISSKFRPKFDRIKTWHTLPVLPDSRQSFWLQISWFSDGKSYDLINFSNLPGGEGIEIINARVSFIIFTGSTEGIFSPEQLLIRFISP